MDLPASINALTPAYAFVAAAAAVIGSIIRNLVNHIRIAI
jgi:hypothetical protein